MLSLVLAVIGIAISLTALGYAIKAVHEAVEPPQAWEDDRTCHNCKHEDLPCDAEPCKSCLDWAQLAGGVGSRWEERTYE